MKEEISLEEFEAFIKSLVLVESILFFFSFLILFLFSSKTFFFSYLLGALITFLDYYLLFKYSKEVPYYAIKGSYPKTGFLWRLLIVSGILLLSLSLFTPINFFAIILAVITGNVGLFIATLKHNRERGKWKEA